MAVEVELRVGIYDVDIAKQSASRVPARVSWVCGVRIHCYCVFLAVAQFVGDVNFKAHISVVGAAYLVSVEIHVAEIHDALEVNQHTFSFIFNRWCESLYVPS